MKNAKRLTALETKGAEVVTVGEVLELASILLVCVAMYAPYALEKTRADFIAILSKGLKIEPERLRAML